MTSLPQDVLLPLLLAATGIGTASPPSVLVGRWGGDGATLVVTAERAMLTLGCGAGSFSSPATVDRGGSFLAKGALQHYRAGPAQPDPTPSGDQAVFTGRIRGDSLSLDVVSADGRSRDHYDLVRNRRTKIVRCL